MIEYFSKKHLDSFLQEASNYVENIDIPSMTNTALAAIKWHDSKDYDKEHFKHYDKLYTDWYASLELDKTNPNYKVYDSPYYLCEAWLCWAKYSRLYLRSIANNKVFDDITSAEYFGEVKSVLDLGCGFGYTTATLKQIFPTATVTGTNFENSAQYKFAINLGKQKDFTISSTIPETDIDVLFASEYFEHILSPVEHLTFVLNTNKPKFLIIANTFGPNAIGHFDAYYHEGVEYTPKQISKIFNTTLKSRGYTAQKTKCWNNRPSFYRLTDA